MVILSNTMLMSSSEEEAIILINSINMGEEEDSSQTTTGATIQTQMFINSSNTILLTGEIKYINISMNSINVNLSNIDTWLEQIIQIIITISNSSGLCHTS